MTPNHHKGTQTTSNRRQTTTNNHKPPEKDHKPLQSATNQQQMTAIKIKSNETLLNSNYLAFK